MKRLVQGLALGAGMLAGCSSETEKSEGSSTEEALSLASPVVATPLGALRGTNEGAVHSFKGIRYAPEPTRFGPPKAAGAWKGTVDAKAYGTTCVQRQNKKPADDADPSAPPPYDVIGGEDCLFLNVWTPADRRPDEKLPVMFFVHGGAYTTGGSDFNPWAGTGLPGKTDLYNGKLIAERGRVVVVTINYRLASLGFTALAALTKEQGGASGNAGLEDMRLALQWVQTNIRSFGGDTARVMAFGESAGAWSMCALIASPLTRGLFSRAGLESMYCTTRTLAVAEQGGAALASKLGCASASDVLACMRSKTKEELMAVDTAPPGLPSASSFNYLPTVEGRFLPDDPLVLIKSGKHNRMPVLIGGNAKEASFAKLVPETPQTFADLATLFASTPQLASQSAVLTSFYGPANYPTAPDAFVAFATDLFMTCPQRKTIRALRASQSEPVYRYVFEGDVPAYLGTLGTLDSFHGAELFYVFQKLNELPAGLPTLPQFKLERRILDYWTSFAHTTRPFSLGAPAWAAYSSTYDNSLFLAENPKTVLGYHAPACDAYDAIEAGQ